jgi:hypothetical protein
VLSILLFPFLYFHCRDKRPPASCHNPRPLGNSCMSCYALPLYRSQGRTILRSPSRMAPPLAQYSNNLLRFTSSTLCWKQTLFRTSRTLAGGYMGFGGTGSFLFLLPPLSDTCEPHQANGKASVGDILHSFYLLARAVTRELATVNND